MKNFLAVPLALACSFTAAYAQTPFQPASRFQSALDPATCAPVQVADLPVHVVGSQAFVPLMVNHQKLLLLLDTGGYVTSLTPDAVTRLAMPASNHAGMGMIGVGGAYVARVVQASDVTYLGHDVGSLPFPVLPDSNIGDDQKVDGIFGANFLSAYDVELDLGAHHVRFFKQAAGCDEAAPSWAGEATKLTAVSAGQNLLMIPVQVNGVTLNAVVDTGSEDTLISHEAAAAAGVDDAALKGDEEITEEGIGASSARMHRFGSISVGGATVRSPVLAVSVPPGEGRGPALVAALDTDSGEHVKVDVILGADFLFKHRVWLGYHHSAVYVENTPTQLASAE